MPPSNGIPLPFPFSRIFKLALTGMGYFVYPIL